MLDLENNYMLQLNCVWNIFFFKFGHYNNEQPILPKAL